MALALSCSLAASFAAAAQGFRVLVLLTPEPPAFWPSLSSELAAADFSAQTVEVSTARPEPNQIETLAARARVSVVIQPLEAGNSLQIWLVDPMSQKLSFREVILGLYGPNDPPDVIAVRIVETLRATIIDLRKARRSAGDLAPLPRGAAIVPAEPRFALGVGGAGLFSPGGLGTVGLLRGSLSCSLGSRFSVVLDGALTPFDQHLREREGEVKLAWYLAGAALRFSATKPTAPLSLRSGAGVWFAHLITSGRGASPFLSDHASSSSAVPHMDLGLRWSMTQRLGIAADATAGFSAPNVAVEVAGRRVATWGRPLFLGSLQLEVSLD